MKPIPLLAGFLALLPCLVGCSSLPTSQIAAAEYGREHARDRAISLVATSCATVCPNKDEVPCVLAYTVPGGGQLTETVSCGGKTCHCVGKSCE